MSLALIGEGAAYEFRWRRWALLRDTLLLIDRAPNRFPTFSAFGDALVAGSLKLPAAVLGEEIAAILRRVRGHTVEELAISPTTASVLYLGAKLDLPRRLTEHERNAVAPPGTEGDLGEFFASMCESMLEVCARPLIDGRIEIIDG
jgi:hypothetical protein